MSSFWSWWIIVLSVGNILACVWLIRWTAKPATEESAESEITGHTWDNGELAEYNNPLPRWWLGLFYGTIFFSIAYLIAYPGLGKFEGLLGWTSTSQYEREVAKAEDTYGPIFAQYAKKPIVDLVDDPEAIQIGRRLFVTYCSVCHGSDAGGASGFPDLTDNDWLYGASPEQVKSSILNGRIGVMPPWGAALGEMGVENVVAYVLTLSGRDASSEKAEAGKEQYDALCAACHMPDGTGNQALGAPNLTDNIWLYGGSSGAIAKTIRDGRQGVMPAHKEFLGEEKVHLLSAYIYGLSQK
ncbi:MAG: cytochrome-c oxidase, cbb3-type subunit III [Gammaproteobacteria bacterium]|nr:cytochrome-c oxidase, cbb3-type subunit III [Gammaproteobacteria bacterium]